MSEPRIKRVSAAVPGWLLGWRLSGRDRQTYLIRGGTKAELLASFGEVLEFPSWYGANLDALRDCLRDVELPDDATIVIAEAGRLERDDPRTLRIVERLLAEVLPETGEMLLWLR